MPNKIQLKRGNKSKMPILAVGEPAFSTDTKELFIGDGSTNQYFNNANENLIINGNFQVVYEDFDVSTGNIIITPGKAKYIYGNYYISNDATSTGNITISKPLNGMVTIVSTNAKMTLEYRERLPEYKTGVLDNYAFTLPFLNQIMTLSFDYQNNGSDVSFLTGNGVDNSNSITLKNGKNNLSNTFNMKYKQKGSDYYMGILLLSNNVSSSYQISIGNFKLELGNTRSSFVPNPLYLDILALEQVYKIYNATTRSTNANSRSI